MANCGYQCTDLPAYLQVICGEYLLGGQNFIGILECDHSITDFTSAAQLITAINNNDLTLIGPVVAEIPAASPVEGANPSGCGPATILDSFERSVTWTDYNVSNDIIEFYNALNRRKTFLIVYHCASQMMTVIEVAVSFVAFRSSPVRDTEKQFFTVTAKWTALDEAFLFDAPAGVFDQA